MDISEEEKGLREEEVRRMKEQGIFWNPKTKERQQKYANWLKKQHKQQQKTLMLDGVTHSRARKDQLRRLAAAYKEEHKRIKDLIQDGR